MSSDWRSRATSATIVSKRELIPNATRNSVDRPIEALDDGFSTRWRLQCRNGGEKKQILMKMRSYKSVEVKKPLMILAVVLMLNGIFIAQIRTKSDIEQITDTLTDYIEGTANGEPERLRRAFHPDFNLYAVDDKKGLLIRNGEKYILGVKKGEKVNRIGRIISIDHEKDAAMAKVEIVIPNSRVFTDYFLLVKYEGSWKIVQKSYTWREYPAAAKPK